MSTFRVVDWEKLSDLEKINSIALIHKGIREKQNFWDFAQDNVQSLSQKRTPHAVIRGFCLVEERKVGNDVITIPFSVAIASVGLHDKVGKREVFISYFVTSKSDSAKRFIATHSRTPTEEIFTRVLTWGKRMGANKLAFTRRTSKGKAFLKKLKSYGWIGNRSKITSRHPSPKTFTKRKIK